MAIGILQETLSIDSFWEELVYTEARLSGDEQAKELAQPFQVLLGRLGTVRGGQLDVWHEEVSAQAAVSAADDRLDDLVRALARALLRVVNDDVKAPLYLRYFASTPSSIIRLGLENEVARVRGWVDSLVSESEKELQELGAQLRTLVGQGDQALERRRKAGAARSDHRVRAITPLIDDINSARFSLYGSLTTKAAAQGLPRDWPDRFFRHSTRSPKEEAQPTATTGQSATPAAK
jgi:hypothetical protein